MAHRSNLKVVCFKWKFTGQGIVMPSQSHIQYTAQHVNTLHSMLKRHLHIPFDLICITDDPMGIDPDITCLPLWDKCRYLGGCFNRLYVFSEHMAKFIGPRFVCIDMDCAIISDITPLFNRQDDFIMNTYQAGGEVNPQMQLYNGGMFMMNAGCRSIVWHGFDPAATPAVISNRKDRIGTDQAWIREILGPDETRWGPEDGIYEARNIGEDLPADAKIVFFAGKRDPSTTEWPWVKEHYQ